MIIYKAENTITGAVYIGQTIKTLKVRKSGHIAEMRRGSTNHFHNALRKYGPEAFSWETIWTALDHDELVQMEKFFIANYRATHELYNLTDGGEGTLGYKPTPETIEKTSSQLRVMRKGEGNPFYGKKHTQETKDILRAKLSGDNAFWYGKRLTDDHKQHVSEAKIGSPAWNKGRPRTPEEKAKISARTKEAMAKLPDEFKRKMKDAARLTNTWQKVKAIQWGVFDLYNLVYHAAITLYGTTPSTTLADPQE